MATYQIIFWRDIPAQVQVFKERRRISRPLSDRFQVAIDDAAMRDGVIGSDAYLEQWRHSEPQSREGEPEMIANAVVEELEIAYPAERLKKLIANGAVE
jgi:hypothetical protein